MDFLSSLILAATLSAFDELYILVIVSIFFCLLYEIKDDAVWSGIVGSVGWLVVGLVWLIRGETVIVSLLFSGLFLFYTVRWILDLLSFRVSGRQLGES